MTIEQETHVDAVQGFSVQVPDMAAESETPAAPQAKRRLKLGHKTSWALRLGFALDLVAGGGTYWAYEHPNQTAHAIESVFGAEVRGRVDQIGLSIEDQYAQLKYKIDHKTSDPFAHLRTDNPIDYSPVTIEESFPVETIPVQVEATIVEPPKLAPLVLPETKTLISNPTHNEGIWSFDGVPVNTPENIMMAWTTFRPDAARPYATVGVLLMDKRRIKLHMIGGTDDPGGDRGVRGPGRIPDIDRTNVLVAWNGGFKGPHGDYGMYADGKFYRPLKTGLATVAVMADGTIKMGKWGEGELTSKTDDMVAVRQNAVLLIKKGEITPEAKDQAQNNNIWGFKAVNSADFITWRSAIGLTKNGNLLYAAGDNLSAKTLAQSLWAAGAEYAMQLDINSPYVLASLYFPQAGGPLKSDKFINSGGDSPNRFMTTQTRDFMYITLDETNFKP